MCCGVYYTQTGIHVHDTAVVTAGVVVHPDVDANSFVISEDSPYVPVSLCDLIHPDRSD